MTIEFATGVGHIDATATGYRATFYGRHVYQYDGSTRAECTRMLSTLREQDATDTLIRIRARGTV